MTDLSAEFKALAAYRPANKVRFVTAASLFDGHDAAINIMRRILQGMGADSNPQATGQTVQNFLTDKLSNAEAARDAQALPYLHEMQTNPQPVDVSPIVNTIDASLAGSAGKRGNVSDALGGALAFLFGICPLFGGIGGTFFGWAGIRIARTGGGPE